MITPTLYGIEFMYFRRHPFVYRRLVRRWGGRLAFSSLEPNFASKFVERSCVSSFPLHENQSQDIHSGSLVLATRCGGRVIFKGAEVRGKKDRSHE